MSRVFVSSRKRLFFGSLIALLWIATAWLPALAADTPPDRNADGPRTQAVSQKPAVVKLTKTAVGYQLTRNGEPYFIRGAGGSGPNDLLAKAGGNSLRTWGADHLDKVLDDAHQAGLSVAVGIWLGHERHGFNYNDADQVATQFAKAGEIIARYKDHSAVLLWGIGNEMEGYGAGDNAAIWSAINNIASLAKRLDPNHPTMTVTAEIGGDRVKNIHRLCPDIDIVGINCYGGIASLAERYAKVGGTKPYIVTEFGPAGVWETPKNSFGAVVELSSTEKAARYRDAWHDAIAGEKGKCLGGYAFTWGNKQEATATWFGMLLPDGSRLGAVDALTQEWTGKQPANRCPTIEKLSLSGSYQVDPDAVVTATLAAKDPDDDKLSVRWVLEREPLSLGTGGDAEEVPPTFPEAIIKATPEQAQVRMPAGGGIYRLYAYVSDGFGNAAVANVPLKVSGKVETPKAKVARLPLAVYDEATRENAPFAPAGWMGNAKAMKLSPEETGQPHAGKTCIKFEYREKDGWGGIVWQSPAGDWGDRPGGWDLTGAKRLVFWARGANGDEEVSFQFGLIADNKPYFDTGKGKLDKIKLTREWKQYTIPLDGQNLSRIKTGFCCVVAATGSPIVFYLDDVTFE